MAICTKCSKEIDCLDYTAVTHTTGVLKIIEDFPDYDMDYIPINEAEFTFDCPECGEELFWDSNEATDFLQGKDI